jgi:hypothetical protein
MKTLWVAPNPKRKISREKKLDFDQFDWTRYISEEKLLEAIPTVYGCDPRDEEKYRQLLETSKANEEGVEAKPMNCVVL